MTKPNSVVETENSAGEKMKIVVRYPTRQQLKEAQLVSIAAFRRAIDAKAMTREGIDDYMRKNGMWDDAKQKEFDEYSKWLIDGERQLARGGKDKEGQVFTKAKARQLALDMKTWRFKQLILLSRRRELDEFTVQGQAENARFDYLVSECTFTEDEKRAFESADDYVAKSDEPYANKAASELSSMLYGLDPDYDKKRPENQFLVKFKFARENDLRLVNEKGDLVDNDNHLINEDGRLINVDGEFIDVSGKRVDAEGSPVEEFVPFEESEQVTS